MYKILITSFAVLLSSLYSWGQDGKYANIGETIGQTIQMYDMDILYNETEPFIYKMNEKGKLVKSVEPMVYSHLHDKYFNVIGIEIVKKKSYWILDCKGDR